MTDLLVLCLFKRDHAVEHSIKLYRDMLVDMAFAKKPLIVITGFNNVFKKSVDFKSFEYVNTKTFL